MSQTLPAPTDQRATSRPISFLLEENGAVVESVMLAVRPEDLTRTEPNRATVHQTLGRSVTGWLDDFGVGLPTCNISGHTGWRYYEGLQKDGFQSFLDLNRLVQRTYPAARQAAIESGRDPASVKLLFVDLLDDFAWTVHPTQFVLRRSKSRPLLFQYNITLQAISTFIEVLPPDVPETGTPAAGIRALELAEWRLQNPSQWDLIKPYIPAAPGGGGLLGGLAGAIKGFMDLTKKILDKVLSITRGVTDFVSGMVNPVISMARDLAQAGTNIWRSVSAILNLPANIKAEVNRLAAAFNEVACIFANALKPRKTYEEYDGLYGASNCSSTTGGRGPSPFLDQNVFQLMAPGTAPVVATSSSLTALFALKNADPVLAPMSLPELARNTSAVVQGVSV